MALVRLPLNSFRVCLPSAPPDGDAGEDHDERQEELTGHTNPVHLRARQGDTAIFRLFGANGNQVFVGRKPVHNVQSQIAIAIESKKGIGSPRGTADHDEAALRIFLAGGVVTGGSDGQRTFFVFRIAGINFRRIQLFRGQARLRRTKQFLYGSLAADFDVEGTGNRKTSGGAFHLADDGVRVVTGDQGDLGAESGKLADGIHVQNQVFVDRNAPILQDAGQRIVVGDFGAAHLQRRIEHEEGAAAVFDEFLDGVDFGLLVIAARASHNQNCAVAGDFGFLQEVDGFREVLILAEQFLELGIAVAAGIVNLVFAAAGDKANRAGRVLQIANEGAGDAFFIQALGFLLVGANLNYSGAVVFDAGFARQHGFFISVDILDVNLWRKIGV